MPFGMNSNGSGVVAILELMRILSKFYENYENVLK
jgi:Zn-dependent M28 family amino/carboxypeptidase